MQIELDERAVEVLTELQEQAKELDVPFHAYLKSIADRSPPTAVPQVSVNEFDVILDQLAADGPSSPPLPADFSRADIYANHD
jgi:hypothetical protein